MRKFASFCLIFVMSISMLCVPAMAAEEGSFSLPDDELICEMGRFISDSVVPFGSDFAANHYDELKVGDAIPTYSLDQGSDSIHPCEIQYYPISADSQIIGLLGAFLDDQGNYLFSYSEGYSETINSVLAEDAKIALLGDGTHFEILTDSNQARTIDDSEVEDSVANLRFIDPYEKLYSLNITTNAEQIPSAHSLPSSYSLSVPTKYRSERWDCWAACVASVGQYYTGIKKSSLQVADAVGIYEGADVYETRDALSSVYGVNASVYGGSLSPLEVEETLYYDETPIIAGMQPVRGGVGHMVVIKGYSTGSYYTSLSIMDPEEGSTAVSISTSNPIQFPLFGETFKMTAYII